MTKHPFLRRLLTSLRSRPAAGARTASPAPAALSPASAATDGPTLTSTSNRYGSRPGRGADVETSTRFVLSAEVAQRFNAYAAAAFPYEIGGMLRVVQHDDGSFEAVDVRVFRQDVSPVYFELDGEAVAEFNMSLFRDGKKDELPQWRSLIHSHPDMTPFMSGPDRENIERLAGTGFAFSVICSAHADPSENYYAVHYAQAQPVKLMVHDLPVSGDGHAGIGDLDDEQLHSIQAEVESLCTDIRDAQRRPHAGDLVALRDRQPAVSAPARTSSRPLVHSAFGSAPATPAQLAWLGASADDEFAETLGVSDALASAAHDGVFAMGELTDDHYELLDGALHDALEEDALSACELHELRAAADGERDVSEPELLDCLVELLDRYGRAAADPLLHAAEAARDSAEDRLFDDRQDA